MRDDGTDGEPFYTLPDKRTVTSMSSSHAEHRAHALELCALKWSCYTSVSVARVAFCHQRSDFSSSRTCPMSETASFACLLTRKNLNIPCFGRTSCADAPRHMRNAKEYQIWYSLPRNSSAYLLDIAASIIHATPSASHRQPSRNPVTLFVRPHTRV